MEKMDSFRTLAWGYQSGVEAIRRNACIDPVNGAALRIMANDIATSAEHMNELMGYVARGSIMYRDGIGTDINDAKRYLEGFGAVLEVVHEDCVSGAQKAALFPEAYYDDVNYGRTLGEVKDAYEYMMNNGLY